MPLLLVWSLLALEPPPGLVTLVQQRASVDPGSGGEPQLLLTAEVVNGAPAAVEAVEIGILFSANPGALADVNAAWIYAEPTLKAEVGAVRRLVAVSLEPESQTRVELAVQLAPGPPPSAFLIHLLSYRLAQPTAPALLTLLRTGIPADEAAAAATLGLARGEGQKHRARLRWGQDADLVAGLAAHLEEPIPEAPSHDDTLTRTYAALALGVLGGDRAAAALAAFAIRPDLGRLDEPLQILRASRLTATALEAPVAHAIPPQAALAVDVVRAAEADLPGWSNDGGAAFELEPTAGEAPEPPADRGWLPPLIAVSVGVAAFLGVGWLFARAAKRRA